MSTSQVFNLTYQPGKATEKPKNNAFSMLLVGNTGSGKTWSVGQLCRLGKRVLVLSTEGRTEAIKRFGPLILSLTSIEDIKKFCQEVLMKPNIRKAWVSSQTDNRYEDIDIVAVDSFMEVESMVDSRMRGLFPDKVGDGSYTRWDQYGVMILRLATILRDVASDANPEPLSIIATLGEVKTTNALGQPKYDRMIRGKVAPPRMPFLFSVIYRLEVDLNEETGNCQFILQTAGAGLKPLGTEESTGKLILPPLIKVNGDKFKKVWAAHEAYYAEGAESALQVLTGD